MNLNSTSIRHKARSFTAPILFLLCNGAMAYGGTYDPVTRVWTADSVTLGGAKFEGMRVKVSGIVSGPTGTSQNGWDASYDTASGHLTVPVVDVGNTRYYNVVATIASMVSPGSVIGADTYDGTQLSIPYVQVGPAGTVYSGVVVTIGNVVRVDGGMPKSARDIYDPGTNQLTIGAVQYGGNIYTNVVVTVRSIVSALGINPPPTLGPSPWGVGCMNCQIGSVQLVNTLRTPLNISNIAIDNPNVAQTSDCPAALGSGQSCAIFVYRIGAGFIGGLLTVTDDGPGSPRSLSLLTGHGGGEY
jgi:hypothetical protein